MVSLYVKIQENILKSMAAAFSAMIVAAAIFAFQPIRSHFLDPMVVWTSSKLWPIEVLSNDEAYKIARSFVGQNALEAIPFRNDNDPNHYILVWSSDGNCGNTEDDDCPHGYGAVFAELLIGGGGSYQRYQTQIPALPGHVSPEAIRGDLRVSATGIVDWNGDGKKEIFAIADQDAFTSAQHNFFVHLYDTDTHKIDRMSFVVNRANVITSVYDGESHALRSWFIDRFNEFLELAYFGVACSRDGVGSLSCERILKQESRDVELDLWELIGRGLEDWTVRNGGDFTLGQIGLTYHNVPDGINLLDQACVLRRGETLYLNYFKGPLAIYKEDTRQFAILYAQDGAHHREIPSLILGKEYLWLGLAYRNDLIAINLNSHQAVPVKISSWSQGIPGEWGENLTLAQEAQERNESTKELQAYIYIQEGTLQYNGEELDLSQFFISAESEFSNAQTCPDL